MTVMEVDGDASQTSRDDIIARLVGNDEIIFKNQQRGEADLTREQKFEIAVEIFDKNKVTFLSRFGRHLTREQLNYFKTFENEEVDIILKDLLREHSVKAHHLLVRNRRYEAMNRLKDEGSYFSEIEMMKRNPLLYEQLVGQYMTEDEKKQRDKVASENATFVKILMEGIERDESEAKRIKQEEEEEGAMEHEEKQMQKIEDPSPSFVRWGEIDEKPKARKTQPSSITAAERRLLKEEFVTTMYESFLEGKDADFDYEKVDENQQYDNIDTLANDAQERYFDSESPEDVEMEENMKEEVEEDELEIYMKHVRHKLEMSDLSKNLKRL